MDNRVVTGVRNIYANEALFRAGIRPAARANRLSQSRIAQRSSFHCPRCQRG